MRWFENYGIADGAINSWCKWQSEHHDFYDALCQFGATIPYFFSTRILSKFYEAYVVKLDYPLTEFLNELECYVNRNELDIDVEDLIGLIWDLDDSDDFEAFLEAVDDVYGLNDVYTLEAVLQLAEDEADEEDNDDLIYDLYEELEGDVDLLDADFLGLLVKYSPDTDPVEFMDCFPSYQGRLEEGNDVLITGLWRLAHMDYSIAEFAEALDLEFTDPCVVRALWDNYRGSEDGLILLFDFFSEFTNVDSDTYSLCDPSIIEALHTLIPTDMHVGNFANVFELDMCEADDIRAAWAFYEADADTCDLGDFVSKVNEEACSAFDITSADNMRQLFDVVKQEGVAAEEFQQQLGELVDTEVLTQVVSDDFEPSSLQFN